MYEYGSLPRARQDGLLEETVGEELLLYDRDSHTAHCLSPIAACVWRHCDGEHDLTGLAQLVGASESLVADALNQLREKDLLVTEPRVIQSAISSESRREAIVRVARYGAAATAGSMIVSATAATPAMASSPVMVCCQCTNTGGIPCACESFVSKSEAENVAQCNQICLNNAPFECRELEGAFLKGAKCVENKCS
ncbi:MAG TPA: hypothetical protein VGY13_00190 [Solirubrobacteraceae bacterium]|jgi:hypothetical protein|nr:hypothetical protein [Solirubrobacteraceae bacterium]